MMQSESQLQTFYASLLTSIVGAPAMTQIANATFDGSITDTLFWSVCEAYASGTSNTPALQQQACTTWSNATGIKGLQALGKLNTNTVNYIASRIWRLCGNGLFSRGPEVQECIGSLRVCIKFMEGHFNKFFPKKGSSS